MLSFTLPLARLFQVAVPLPVLGKQRLHTCQRYDRAQFFGRLSDGPRCNFFSFLQESKRLIETV